MTGRPSNLPPADFSQSTLISRTIKAGQTWLRLHRKKYPDPLGCGFGPSRFSDPLERDFKVIYLGHDLETCFLETVFRDIAVGTIGEFPLESAELDDWRWAEIRLESNLAAVDLNHGNMVAMRIPTDVARAQSHQVSRMWSAAFWGHEQKPDGIAYPSRLNGAPCIALYDRCHRELALAGSGPLLGRGAELAAILDKYQIGII